MRSRTSVLAAGLLALAACNQATQQAATNQPTIKVRSAEQDALHKLDALNLAIAPQARDLRCRLHLQAGDRRRLRRRLQESRHVDGALRLRQGQPRDWAIFAGPDGSAQVRDCKDVVGTELPQCKVKPQLKGAAGTAD